MWFLTLAILSSSLTPAGAPPNFELFDFDKSKIEEKVQSFDGIVVVDFGAPWCIDCRVLDYGMPKVIKSHPDVLFLSVNVDRVRTARQDFRIYHIPDVRFYRGNMTQLGQIVEGRAAHVDAKIKEIKAAIAKESQE